MLNLEFDDHITILFSDTTELLTFYFNCLFHGLMLNLNFLSLDLFIPLLPSPLHKQQPDSST